MKHERTIYITNFDLERLKILIKLSKVNDSENKGNVQQLVEKINRAKVVHSDSIPLDTVTMNSKVHLADLDSGMDITIRLVFPKDADVKNGRISVTTALGTSLLGCRKGDIAEWQVSSSNIKFRAKIIEILYQPEKYGHRNM
ncbi:MAG: GreA/GreB family elongation factor [Candidatus Latescibacterota bacterium]